MVESAGLTDRQLLQRIFNDRQYRYLARQHCWVFSLDRLVALPVSFLN
jgi:hypothetical protein